MPKHSHDNVSVNISVLNDGLVALVFPRSLVQFTASAEDMTQLGVNLIKAATVASMQHPQAVNAPKAPARKM